MFATPAMAQTATTSSASGGLMGALTPILPFIPIVVLFYFLMIRPQQKRMKEHQAMVAGVKRGDTVVLSSGLIGKVTKVDDVEATIEIAPGVNAKVVKSMVAEVRSRNEPAPANDSKS
jgi:preprotein translocase subunit YajC